MLASIIETYGRLDLLVNNAGVAPEQRLDMLDTTADSYDRVLGINLRGPFFLTQKVARRMIDQLREKPGRKPAIVFVTSISAYVSSPSRAEYCVSKAGLSMTAAMFADRLAAHGINVYEVRPGRHQDRHDRRGRGEIRQADRRRLDPAERAGEHPRTSAKRWPRS